MFKVNNKDTRTMLTVYIRKVINPYNGAWINDFTNTCVCTTAELVS